MSELVLATTSTADLLRLSSNDALKVTAMTRLSEIGLASKKTEHYRPFALDALLLKSYTLYSAPVEKIKVSNEIIIEDGQLISAPVGLNIVIETNDTMDAMHFDPMYYVTHLSAQSTVKITLRDGQDIKLVHRYTKENALIPYKVEVVVEKQARASVYERFEQPNTTLNSLVLYSMNMDVQNVAQLEWIREQELANDKYAMIGSHHLVVQDDAKARVKTFDFGDGKIIHNLKIDLHHYAHVDAQHMVYANKHAHRGNIVRINHIGEHASCNQKAKHIIKDRAHGIFDGLVKVEHTGKFASAHQNANSLILDDKAVMFAKPQLEIYIDELEASHGATTGQLSPKEIFYLQSRGISEENARKMLIVAFAKDVIDTVVDEEVKERITKSFETLYGEAS